MVRGKGRKRLAMIQFGMILILGILVACGGGGGGGDGGGSPAPPTTRVSEDIPPAGGTVEHPDGVTLEFMEGSFEAATEVTIELAEMPEKTTRAAEPVGSVYRLEIHGPPSEQPVKIRMPLPPNEEGPFTIYRYDGETWYSAGGEIDGNFVETFSNDFSLFTTVRMGYPAARVKFTNQGFDSCIVKVGSYRLADPVNSPPVSPGFSWPVFHGPGTYERWGWLSPGTYTFCLEYRETKNWMYAGWRHRMLGPHGIGVNPSGNPLPMPASNFIDFQIGLHNTQAGRCAPTTNLGSDPGTNPDGTPISLRGEWTIRLRCVGQDRDAITMTMEIDEAGGSFSGTGTGTDYDGQSLQVTVQGGYYRSTNTISGTIDVNNGSSEFTFQTDLAADTGYFSIRRTRGHGCEAEARFVKN